MASRKHEHPKAEEPESKRTKLSAPTSSPSEAKQRVVLNTADCNLDFDVEGNGLQGHALHEQGFAYCWSGARANVGIKGGKYCFGCKIVSAQPVDMEDTPPDQKHVCRVGISRGDDAVGNLGETEHSYGFGGTGKFSSGGKFTDYGMKFGVGDTIVCAVNLENQPLAFVGFFKNGQWLGTAKQFDAGLKGLAVVDSPVRKLEWESALFPHVLLKNVVVQLQFSAEDGLIPQEGYKPWASALEDGNAIMGPKFSSPKDCEVLMMVGLPASGKTTWAEKWVKEHPEKCYVVLGTNLALEQMKVPGLLRKQNYGERFERLMDRATGIFNTLLSRAAKTPRNYILDQTNVYKNARKRKLKPFVNYCKIAVVIFPRPEELMTRGEKRFKEMGKEVPAEAVNEMLANYVLPKSKEMPGSDEFFDQVIFPELNRADSERYLDEMKRAMRAGSISDSRSNLSPYSHGGSVHSYSSPSMLNREALPATGGGWQHSHSPLPQRSYDQLRPREVHSPYHGADVHGTPGGYRSGSSNCSLPIPRECSYGTHVNYVRSPLPRDGGNDLFSSVDPNYSPNFERIDSYRLHTANPGTSFSYNSPSGHLGATRTDLSSSVDPYYSPTLKGWIPTDLTLQIQGLHFHTTVLVDTLVPQLLPRLLDS
ncbi:heterogeneous nuclear ribonucleoprotein U-like protein 1 [Macadamia integrifolia]|uniref:heterogeneous nuclear ribonucleoprotein U-like protein 1 n=1 Tax=Macadamia integrifolia TaxID=60698 RepID=UPI001C4F908D|nr:heterogeneous nuclear ribonucleoprotein U-like protein 1 [Macadamia integrifolia]XP_042516043.1 heterogeneous nuclear ribonucleoprotein U-like protein 1 [Macadamia integrifolia]